MSEGEVMADWFKMYENGIDEGRFKYALAKNPLALNVWVWVLSECCRCKSDTIDGGKFDVFGAHQKLNIPEESIQKCLDLLADVSYISLQDNKITVLKWNKRQSDYCRRQSAQCADSVRTVSEQSLTRGEEKRGEEKRKASSKRLSEVEKKRKRVVENSPMMIRIGEWFGRRGSTRWSLYEAEALTDLGAIPEDELRAMQYYYEASIKKEDDFRRRNLETLLNNWSGELDRAVEFCRVKKYQVNGVPNG